MKNARCLTLILVASSLSGCGLSHQNTTDAGQRVDAHSNSTDAGRVDCDGAVPSFTEVAGQYLATGPRCGLNQGVGGFFFADACGKAQWAVLDGPDDEGQLSLTEDGYFFSSDRGPAGDFRVLPHGRENGPAFIARPADGAEEWESWLFRRPEHNPTIEFPEFRACARRRSSQIRAISSEDWLAGEALASEETATFPTGGGPTLTTFLGGRHYGSVLHVHDSEVGGIRAGQGAWNGEQGELYAEYACTTLGGIVATRNGTRWTLSYDRLVHDRDDLDGDGETDDHIVRALSYEFDEGACP